MNDTKVTKNTAELIEMLRGKGVTLTEELCIDIAQRCSEIFKAGLEMGTQIGMTEYENVFAEKLKEISNKLGGPAKTVFEVLSETLRENTNGENNIQSNG